MTRNDTNTAAIGNAGKTLVKQYFLNQGYNVEDFEGAPEDYIDFVVTKDGISRKVFVRTDTRLCTTGNIMVERLMHRFDENSIEYGWLFCGKADILSYLDAFGGTLYFFDWNSLKKYATEHCKVILFKNPFDQNTVGDAYVIPTRELEKAEPFLSKTVIDVSSLGKFNFLKPRPF